MFAAPGRGDLAVDVAPSTGDAQGKLKLTGSGVATLDTAHPVHAPALCPDSGCVVRERRANISRPTRVHARVTRPRQIARVCGAFVIAETRPYPRFPPQNLNGKEGVDGSSPSEGSRQEKIPEIGIFCLRRTPEHLLHHCRTAANLPNPVETACRSACHPAQWSISRKRRDPTSTASIDCA